jgi:alpha-L-rhamnosidase
MPLPRIYIFGSPIIMPEQLQQSFTMKTASFLFLIQLSCLAVFAQIRVEKLSTEYLTNPIGIDAEKPRLSWMIGSPEHDVRQTAYQVLVASSPKNLDDARADIWNSGKLVSGNSVLVPYKGSPLSSGKRYYWKVRIWDQKGHQSVSTETAFWEMGMLKKEDWKGKWISAPKVYDWLNFKGHRKAEVSQEKIEDTTFAPQFRKSFQLERKIANARLYLSGLGFNLVYINGQKVGDHILDQAFTRYDKTVLYSTFDVTAVVHTGINALGVVLGNGWYNMISKDVWGFDQASWRSAPVLMAQLEIVFEDGSRQTIASDETWKVAPGPIFFNSIRQGEYYDARRETQHWNRESFNDQGWYQPAIVSGPSGKLKSQMIQPVKITDTIVPKTITEPKPNIYVFDLGQNIAGFSQLRIEAPAGTEIKIKCGERLQKDGTVELQDVAQHVVGGVVQTDKYICKGEGVETWHPSFSYYGFQYVEVSGLPSKPGKETITGMRIHTAFEPAGNFQCSNELFNKIQQNALSSYQSNFMGYPTDCPQREKNGWTGDAHLAAEMGLYNFKAQNGYTKWLGDIDDEQKPTGELAAIVPTAGWGYFWGNGPAWDNAMVLIPWYLYRYDGDQRILEQMYPNVKRYVDYLGTKADNYIVGIGLGDWAPAKTTTPPEVTSTAYYYVDAVLLSKMAGLFGHTDDQKKYAVLAAKIKEAFNKKYYKGNGVYEPGSQTALACALYQGLADDAGKTIDALVSEVKKSDDHLDCGILGTKYLLHALSDHGHADLAYKIVNQHSFPGWGYWIDQGATTLWEQWNGTESLNHIMYGDVSAWFYESLAGIAPYEDQPGFKKISFKPYFPPDLQWVRATHQSMYGDITANWERKGKVIYYQLTIPANTTGVVILPRNKKIFVDNKPIQGSGNVKEIREEADEIKFVLGSGSYLVTIQ